MPLADRIRPSTLDEVVGQRHILAQGKPLYNIISRGKIPNMIFYGPSGVGKTTVANIIAQKTSMSLYRLNGTQASTSDIKDVVANLGTFGAAGGILLFLDEIQYLNKKQQQTLLEYIESGEITLIASTTENPYFYVYSAVLSRCTVFEFKQVTAEDILPAVERAFRLMGEEMHTQFTLEEGVVSHIAYGCGGDVRKAINSVELCVLSSPADESGVCLLLVHHTRKQQADDRFDMISGTNGLLGAADGAFLLQKERRTDCSATLDISGRDQQDQRLYLTRNSERLIWELQRAETEFHHEAPDPVLEAVAAFITSERPVWCGTATELAAALEISMKPNALAMRLNVRAWQLNCTYHICYESARTHAGRSIRLTLDQTVCDDRDDRDDLPDTGSAV